jgi:predicted  nucleic acid-binding Zn-ribbon protein
MKHFCSICGKPTIYALALPKFCSQCGSDFSLVTKEKDKTAHDKAIEVNKEKYGSNTPEFKPVTKPEPKNYPNPARASFKLVNDDDVQHDEHESEDSDIDPSIFSSIKPKFKVYGQRASAESFESMMTQSYASNYKPADLSEMRNQSTCSLDPNAVLEQFKREAGASRHE